MGVVAVVVYVYVLTVHYSFFKQINDRFTDWFKLFKKPFCTLRLLRSRVTTLPLSYATAYIHNI